MNAIPHPAAPPLLRRRGVLLVICIGCVLTTSAGVAGAAAHPPWPVEPPHTAVRRNAGGQLVYNKQNARPPSEVPQPAIRRPYKPLWQSFGPGDALRRRQAAGPAWNQAALGGVAMLLAVGILSHWLGWLLRIPLEVLLLAAGLALGPLTDWVVPDRLFGNLLLPIVSLLLAVFLYDRAIRWRTPMMLVFGGGLGRRLGIASAVTGGIAAAAAYAWLDLDASASALLGAVVAVSSPTLVAPSVEPENGGTAREANVTAEGTVLDTLGAIVVVCTFEMLFAHGSRPLELVGQLLLSGAAVGLLGGALLHAASSRPWLPAFLHRAVSLMAVVGAFAIANLMHAQAGWVAVIVMGLTLRGDRQCRMAPQLRTMVLSTAVVLLAARLHASDLAQLDAASVLFAVLLVAVVRPLGRGIATIGFGPMAAPRRLFASTAAPGIIAVMLATTLVLGLNATRHLQVFRLLPLMVLLLCAESLRAATLLLVRRALPWRDEEPAPVVAEVAASQAAAGRAGAALANVPSALPSDRIAMRDVLFLGGVALLSYQLGSRVLAALYFVFPALVVPAFLFPRLFPARPPLRTRRRRSNV